MEKNYRKLGYIFFNNYSFDNYWILPQLFWAIP